MVVNISLQMVSSMPECSSKPSKREERAWTRPASRPSAPASTLDGEKSERGCGSASTDESAGTLGRIDTGRQENVTYSVC
jgi:hypothetical protein